MASTQQSLRIYVGVCLFVCLHVVVCSPINTQAVRIKGKRHISRVECKASMQGKYASVIKGHLGISA
jgi:hypothetical protein